MPRFKHLIFLLAFYCLIASEAAAQSSPYSRYGIGDLLVPSGNTGVSMGGINIGYRSPFHINNMNPASYTAFDTLAFIFEGGVRSNTVSQRTEFSSQQNNNTSLSHLLFGFPITNWWKSSVGLMPFSEGEYSIVDKQVDPVIGSIEKTFTGEGGINSFYFGNAFLLNKKLSIGFNISYLFGSNNRTRALVFPDSAYMRNFRVINATNYGDLKLDFGLQYQQKIGKDLNLVTGLVFSNGTNISAKDKILEETYVSGSTGIDYPKDTISYIPELKGNVFLPMSYGLGFTLGKKDKWLVGLDYRFQEWEKYSYFGTKDSLKNSYSIALGGEYTPNITGVGSYTKKMTYRAGVRYGKTYLELHDKQLSEFAVSAGIGFPFSKIRSTVNLGIEVGQRGTTSSSLIQDNFFRLTLGVSIFERWFIRRRFE